MISDLKFELGDKLFRVPTKLGQLRGIAGNNTPGFLPVRRGVTKQTTDARIAPFAWVFMHALQFLEPGGRMAFHAIFARFDAHMFRARRHGFGFVFSGKVIKTTDDNDNDDNKKQIA